MRFILRMTLFVALFWAHAIQAQAPPSDSSTTKAPFFKISGGYDQPLYGSDYAYLSYTGGFAAGIGVEHYFTDNFGWSLDYTYIENKPKGLIPIEVYYWGADGLLGASTSTLSKKLSRHFIGLGPTFKTKLRRPLIFNMKLLAGISQVSGGDILISAINPLNSVLDPQLFHTGYQSWGLAAKGEVGLNYKVSKNLHIELIAYYMQHFGFRPDFRLDLQDYGATTAYSGEIKYLDDFTVDQGQVSYRTGSICHDLASLGIGLRLRIILNSHRQPKTQAGCCCPDDKHKLLVTILDKLSGKPIPNADAVIRDMTGMIVAAGKSNSYGTVDFGLIKHGDYAIEGKVFGIETTTTIVREEEFGNSSNVHKEIFYEDKRFILKGNTRLQHNRQLDPGVTVSLVEKKKGDVKQTTSNENGAFTFHLEANSDYEVFGKKEGRLSNIEGVTTAGLNRSTTLFVELELPLRVIKCGEGLVLDIFYDFDSTALRPASRFELQRIVRFLNDHLQVKVELSSHTDSRGSHKYNQILSQRRAESVVSYLIQSRIRSDRLIARGYGETRLVNGCADGIPCSEDEHEKNRRTEITLLCN